MKTAIALLSLLASGCSSAPTATTTDFVPHVVRCPVKNERNIDAIFGQTKLDIWSHETAPGGTIDVYVQRPAELAIVEETLELKRTDCETLINDVPELIKSQTTAEMGRNGGRKIIWNSEMEVNDFFNDYQPFDSMVELMKKLQDTYPSYATFNESIGMSVEGRKIPSLKISDPSATGPKKAVFWNGGQHAREWVSPSTVFYLANQLLEKREDPKVSSWLQKLDFHFIPMQNPDGYQYSQVKARTWRKNRSRNKGGAFGVDLNRNWDEHFGSIGTSNDPRDDTYRGPSAFSEPETKAVSDYILSTPNRYAGIDFHSYSQLVLRNWGWTDTASKNEAILKDIGDSMSAAIKKQSGKYYTSETGADLYKASGCADDWMAAKGSMVSFTLELRDTGRYGFLLPAEQIVPVGQEVWAAMLVFVDKILATNIPPNEYL